MNIGFTGGRGHVVITDVQWFRFNLGAKSGVMQWVVTIVLSDSGTLTLWTLTPSMWPGTCLKVLTPQHATHGQLWSSPGWWRQDIGLSVTVWLSDCLAGCQPVWLWLSAWLSGHYLHLQSQPSTIQVNYTLVSHDSFTLQGLRLTQPQPLSHVQHDQSHAAVHLGGRRGEHI